MKEIQFKKSTNLQIIENKDEYIFKKGVIHTTEIIIDKKESSPEFIDKLKELLKKGKITIRNSDNNYYDFEKLFRFGFLQLISKGKVLLIIPDYLESVFKNISCSNCIEFINNILSYEDSKVIIENKNAESFNKIVDKSKKVLTAYDRIYFVNDLSNVTRNRAFSRLMHKLDKNYIMGLYDNENIYMFGVNNAVTGCYECLEANILAKFDVKPDHFDRCLEEEKNTIDECSASIIAGFFGRDMQSVDLYETSYLTGNVVHIMVPNFEFSLDVNRRSPFCPNCASFNELMLEEQNVRAINILKEMNSGEKK